MMLHPNPNPENLAFHNTGDTASLPDIAVTRAHAINSPIPPVNDAVHAAFTDPTTGNPNTVWQYYKLIGVQATPVDGPPPATATADDLSYYYMANIMVETNQALQNFTGSVTASLQTPPGKVTNVYVNGARWKSLPDGRLPRLSRLPGAIRRRGYERPRRQWSEQHAACRVRSMPTQSTAIRTYRRAA